MAVNNVTLIGNAVNPDLKTSAGGMEYLNFGLAVYTCLLYTSDAADE